MKNLILVGGGGHCRSCIDVIEAQQVYRITGILDLSEKVGDKVLGYPIIGTEEMISELVREENFFLVTLGQIKSPERRIAIYTLLQSAGARLATIISPRAYVSRHARVAPGSIVMHDALVNAGAEVGVNGIVNNKALVEHDAQVGDHCHISTAAVVNGGVRVGSGSFIGSNVVTRQYITIGRNVIVGSGVNVRGDVADNTLYLGKPESSR